MLAKMAKEQEESLMQLPFQDQMTETFNACRALFDVSRKMSGGTKTHTHSRDKQTHDAHHPPHSLAFQGR